MQIVKRSFISNPMGSMTIWLIPTMSYFFGKFGGITYHREWMWWVMILVLFLGWLLLNFKIKK
jgi:FtsH-binding integral membrane protein